MATVQPGIRINTFPISAEATKAPMEPAEARQALMEAVRAVPEEELRNFRGGHLLVVL
jgi:hypothetical protein